jgi:hypothetical protein
MLRSPLARPTLAAQAPPRRRRSAARSEAVSGMRGAKKYTDARGAGAGCGRCSDRAGLSVRSPDASALEASLLRGTSRCAVEGATRGDARDAQEYGGQRHHCRSFLQCFLLRLWAGPPPSPGTSGDVFILPEHLLG